jgi:hypothetical protein
MKQVVPPLVVAAAVVAYVFFWCGLMIAIARASGWIALAQKYRATEPFAGRCWRMQHAQFRWGLNYSFVLTVGVDGSGLYLSTIFPFRAGHPALFIPWSETKIEMKRSFWQGSFMEIRFPKVPHTCMGFGESLAHKIAAMVGAQLVESTTDP